VPALPGSGEAEVVVRCPAGTSSGQPAGQDLPSVRSGFHPPFRRSACLDGNRLAAGGRHHRCRASSAAVLRRWRYVRWRTRVSCGRSSHAGPRKMRDGRPVTLEARERPEPGVAVARSQQLLLRATAEDARAARHRLGSRRRADDRHPPSREFWTGVLSDYLALFVRQERPFGCTRCRLVRGLSPRSKARSAGEPVSQRRSGRSERSRRRLSRSCASSRFSFQPRDRASRARPLRDDGTRGRRGRPRGEADRRPVHGAGIRVTGP